MPLFRFEHKTEPVASPSVFARRLLIHGGVGLCFIGIALGLGMLGYRVLERMTWIDSFLNASMILGGMGPVGELHTAAGKIFAGLYALFSGVVFLVVVGTMLAPVAHRLIHRLHAVDDND